MKKLLLLFSLVLLGQIEVNAQSVESGSLSVLKEQETVNFVCDFSNCLINGRRAKSVIASNPNWDKGVQEIIARFDKGQLDRKRKGIEFGNFPEAQYTLTYYLLDIDDDQDTKGYMIITETKTGREICKIKKANGKAGRFGSFFNLLGDAFENLGVKIGWLIWKG